MATSFSEFIAQDSKKRKHGDNTFDEEQPPDLPWSTPYEGYTRKEYPWKSRADIYKHFAIDPRFYTRTEDPSANIPPYVLPGEPEVDFTLFSADIICKYWSLKDTRLISFRDWRHKIDEINVPSTWLAGALGGVSGYAMYASFSSFATVGANWLLMKPVPSSLVGTVSTFTSWATGSTHPVASGISGLATFGEMGRQVKKRATDKVDSWWIEKRKKRARGEALKKYEDTSKQALQDIDPDLLDLRIQCANIYSLLCETRKLGKCPHAEPYNCRKMYLDSWGDQVNVITAYLDLPNRIIDRYVQRQHSDVSEYEDVVKPFFKEWYNIIIHTLPAAAGEVGLILSILFPMIYTVSHRTVLSVRTNTLLSWLFQTNESLYKMAIHSCIVSMLLSKDNSYIDFIKKCIFPQQGDPRRFAKTNVLEEIWQQVEEKLGDISIDIKIRMQRKYDFRGETAAATDGEAAGNYIPPPFEITLEMMEMAGVIDEDIKKRIAGYDRNPVKAYISYFRLKNMDEQETYAWIVAFRDMVRRLDDKVHKDIYKSVVHPLISLVLDSYSDYRKGIITGHRVTFVALLYKIIKSMLINSREELAENIWTKEKDREMYRRIMFVMRFDTPTDPEDVAVFSQIQNAFEDDDGTREQREDGARDDMTVVDMTGGW